MRKSIFLNVLLAVLFLTAIGTSKVYCQVQRQVNSSMLTQTICAIPEYVDESELSPLDWVYMERDDLYRCSEHIIKGDTLTITHYYPQKPRWENDYEYQMGKSVTSIWGTALYYHNGKEYHRIESYNPDFIVHPAEIEYYGIYNQSFDIDKEELIELLQAVGYQVFEQEGFIIAAWEDFELSINLDELIEEMRFFGDEDNDFFAEEGNKLEYLTRNEYARVNGYVIPVKRIDIRYSELPSGIPYEITKIELYSFYQVIKNGNNTIAEMGDRNIFEDCRNSVDDSTHIKEIQQADIKIYPNPAKEQITIDLPFDGDENVDVKIFNMLGVNVLSQHYNKGGQINMDIHSLPAGVYVVRCVKDSKVISKRFVKQ